LPIPQEKLSKPGRSLAKAKQLLATHFGREIMALARSWRRGHLKAKQWPFCLSVIFRYDSQSNTYYSAAFVEAKIMAIIKQ